MCKIARRSEYPFAFYSNFSKCAKRRRSRKKQRKKIDNLAARISEMAGAISFKVGMWTPLAGGKLCSKFGSNRIRDHRDTKV